METGKIMQRLRALESHWQLRLPEPFVGLYDSLEDPFLSRCEFYPLDALVNDDARWRGMLPQFLPFGDDGEENVFGLFVPSNSVGSDFPVLQWDHEYDHYHPVASSFDAFLRWCLITGRYIAQDAFDEDDEELEEDAADWMRIAAMTGIPASLLEEPVPRNDRELHETIVRADGQNAWSLAHLGGRYFGQGQLEKARDYYFRASEAAPWFADPYYLLAESFRQSGDYERACTLWWRVFELPIAFSTRTSNYDLGAEHPDAEIYETAANRCLECRESLARESAGSPLWELLQQGDPFSPAPRFALAERLKAEGDAVGRERELLNALTLATENRDIDGAYEALIGYYDRTGRARDAALCRRDMARKE